MGNKTFRAFRVQETPDHRFRQQVEEVPFSSLPEHEVVIQVHFSSLNYKDALSASGNKGVTKKYPHTPGIDAAGIVTASESEDYAPGDPVIVTGDDLGMNTAGGFGEYIRVPADWIIPLPDGLTLRESMIYGTAGFTAGLAALKMSQLNADQEAGEYLVTGATGGVGSFTVALLSKLGYEVVAATGKVQAREYLKQLGANRIIDRNELHHDSSRPLLTGRWAGAVDTVGGGILSTVLRSTKPEGIVIACGNAASASFDITVYPFILRGLSLLGIASASCPMHVREKIWQNFAVKWKIPGQEDVVHEINLDNLQHEIDKILHGEQIGRALLKHDVKNPTNTSM